METNNPDDLLIPAEVAGILRCRVSTLATWRAAGRGPEWFRTGRKSIVYRRGAVERYLQEQEALAREQQSRRS